MAPKFLKTVYMADGAICALIFLGGLFASSTIATLTGLPLLVVQIGAWICLPTAALLFWLAGQNKPPALPAAAIVYGNLGWVIASFAILVAYYTQLTLVGQVFMVAQALGVLAFALMEKAGMQVAQEAYPA